MATWISLGSPPLVFSSQAIMSLKPVPPWAKLRCPNFFPWPSQSDTTCSFDAQSITDEPSSFFVHAALPSERRHAGRLLIVHAKHTHTHTSHRNPIRSLYWRSKARSPHWASVAAVSPGHMSGLGALERRNLVVAPGDSARS